MAETSDRISSLAARYAKLEPETLMALAAKPSTAASLAADVRTIAASCLAQDQHKGLRGLIKRVLGS